MKRRKMNGWTRVLLAAGGAGSILTAVSLAPESVTVVHGEFPSVPVVQHVSPWRVDNHTDPVKPTTPTPVPVTTQVVPVPVTETPTTIGKPTAVVATPELQPKPSVESWQSVFDEMAAKLPGSYTVWDRGSWGAANLGTGEVFIAPRTPLWALRSVMIHEGAHVIQGRKWGGRAGAEAELSSAGGIEVVADCMALRMGATWINYGCTPAADVAAAKTLGG